MRTFVLAFVFVLVVVASASAQGTAPAAPNQLPSLQPVAAQEIAPGVYTIQQPQPVRGLQGPRGLQGVPGNVGAQGSQGIPGPQGAKGEHNTWETVLASLAILALVGMTALMFVFVVRHMPQRGLVQVAVVPQPQVVPVMMGQLPGAHHHHGYLPPVIVNNTFTGVGARFEGQNSRIDTM